MEKEKFVKECCLLMTYIYVNGQSTEDFFRKVYDTYVTPETVHELILKKLLARKESLKLDPTLTDRERELISLHIGSLYEGIVQLTPGYESA